MISPVDLVVRAGVGGRLLPFFKCVCVYFVALGAGGDAPGAGAAAAKCAPVLCLLLVVLLHHAALPHHNGRVLQGAVRAARGGGAGAVGAGRRVVGVAAPLRGGHGGVCGGARSVRGRVRPEAAAASRCVAAVRRHGLLPDTAGAAGAAARARACVRRAPGHDGVARGGALAARRSGRAAVPRVRRHPRVQSVRRSRALQAGAGDVHVLRGATGHRAQRAGAAAAAALSAAPASLCYKRGAGGAVPRDTDCLSVSGR